MAEIQTITDQNWEQTVADSPALILLTTGEGLRGDFNTQFKKAAQETEHILFTKVDPTANPVLAEKFSTREKPVLVGYYQGETLVRRVRPWGTDVVLALELLQNKYEEMNPTMQDNNQPAETNNSATPNNVPVHVTDNDFQEQVIDYSNEMPVLVDFWAEWCGPCKMVAPIMEKLAEEYAGQIRVAKVDTDQNQGLAQAFRIMSIPTIMAFKDGHLVFSQPGAFPEAAFRQLVDQVIELDVQAAIAEHEAQHGHDHEHDHDHEH